MNGLLAAMAVANPVITALLTIVVFLEKDKLKKRSEDIEAALKNGNAAIVQTIEAQKQDFTNIADRLEALSKDSEKSAETFIGLSTALTESSAVSAKALGRVTEGLQAHATSIAGLVTELSTKVSETSATAITGLGIKTEKAINGVADQVGRVEAAQAEGSRSSAETVAKLTQEIAQTSKSIKELQETLKSTVTL
jgi:ABC-type transporter Mla subunit MlaD